MKNTTIAQLTAQLDYVHWDLDQTIVRAPADGYVTASTHVRAQKRTRSARC
jgi:multidrug resistance efflux pump